MRTLKILMSSTVFAVIATTGSVYANDLTQVERLGKSIFFDNNLSINQNQACAVCHGPDVGWTGPIEAFNKGGSVYEGSVPSRFGNRKPPSAAYATQSPIFHVDKKGSFVGGNFWDGRATGEKLGNPAADQAQAPFLNPVEQALPDSACVVYRVCNPIMPGDYPVSFEQVWGSDACDIDWPLDVNTDCGEEGTTVALDPADRAKSDEAYDGIALSIAAFEASSEVNAFSSKYDFKFGGKVKLSKQEQRGFALFRGKGQCHRCHISNGQQALFTDYTFDNLGVPRNPENPVYDVDPDFTDLGLGAFLAAAGYPQEVYEAELGKQKVPTLRNVDLRPDGDFVKAYMHNGYFKTLEGVVHFYNTRDVKPSCESLGIVDATEAVALANDCWPAPEVAENVNTDELGDLGLTPDEEAAIVAFLKALSDGYEVP
jgi:cytochrome c peroxidase